MTSRSFSTNEMGCWLVNEDKSPYPRVMLNGQNTMIRNAVYEMLNEQIDPSNRLYNICSNPNCIRPDHMVQKRLSSEFEIKITKDGHWIPQNCRYSTTGYPMLTVDGALIGIKTYLWVNKYGELPTGSRLVRKCDGGIECCNPDHYEVKLHFEKCEITVNGCSECSKHRSQLRGYPDIWLDGRHISASRYLYMREKVNPESLFIYDLVHKCNGTPVDMANLEQLMDKNDVPYLQHSVESEIRKPLSFDRIREIYHAEGPIKEIAAKYNVSTQMVTGIKDKSRHEWATRGL